MCSALQIGDYVTEYATFLKQIIDIEAERFLAVMSIILGAFFK